MSDEQRQGAQTEVADPMTDDEPQAAPVEVAELEPREEPVEVTPEAAGASEQELARAAFAEPAAAEPEPRDEQHRRPGPGALPVQHRPPEHGERRGRSVRHEPGGMEVGVGPRATDAAQRILDQVHQVRTKRSWGATLGSGERSRSEPGAN